MSGDAVVAGRLEIPVESDLTGFAQKLKAAVEKAAEDVVAGIGIELDDGGLRKKLETAVDEAASHVKATIGIEVNASSLKAKLEAAAKSAGGIQVGTHVSSIAAELKKVIEEGKKAAGDVEVPVSGKGGNRFVAWVRTQIAKAQAVARANPVTIPVQQGGGPGSVRGGLSRMFGGGGGGAAGGGGKGGKGGKTQVPDWLQPKGNARSSFMPIVYTGIASVIQPAIATIGGSLGGLAAMAGSAAAAVNTLGGAGGALGALVASFAGVTIAFKTLMEGKLEDLPKSLQGIRKEVDTTAESWTKFREGIALSFWKELDGQIESTGKVLFPILSDGLKGVNTELGEAAKATTQWMRTPLFKKQSDSIFYTMRGVVDGLGAALLGVGKGLINMTQAAGPMLSKFGDVLRDFGEWASGIGEGAAGQKRLGDAFEYAWDKAAQLWDMAKNLGATIKAVFHAGRDSGDSLLGSLQDVIAKWREWSTSDVGQERIARWFKNVEPIARAAGRIIVDLAKALGRLSEDGHTADLLEKIRVELLPSLETFLRNLGSTLGPAVVTFITEILEVLTQMSAAGSPLSQGLSVINKLIGGLADIFQANPELAKNVGILLGALMGFRALTFFSSIIPGMAGLMKFIGGGGKAAWLGAAGGIALFSGALSGLPGPAQGAWAAISTLLTLVPSIRNFSGQSKGMGAFSTAITNLGTSFRNASAPIGGFKGKMAGLQASFGYGAGAAGRGVAGAAKGLMGLLGGPWGLAITGAAAVIGHFVGKQQEAKASTEQLTDTLDKQTGAFTAATEEGLVRRFQSLFDPEDYAKVKDSLEAAGVGVTDFINAYKQGGDAVDQFKSKFDVWQRQAKDNLGVFYDPRDLYMLDALGNTYNDVGNEILGAKTKSDQLRDAQNQLNGSSGTLADGISGVAGQIVTALTPTENLADALERITGVTMGAREADRRYEEAKASLKDAIQKGDKVIKDSTGAVTNATEAGRRYNERLDSMASAAVNKAEADLKAGKGVDAVVAKMNGARAAFIENARRFGYSESAANDLADQAGLTSIKVGALASKIKGLPDSHTTDIYAHDHASGIISGIKRALGGITDRVFNIGAAFGWRHGGIQEFFEGGIRGLNSYARGKLPRDAMIARDGANLVQWAESGTGGEAFIPLGAQNRPRSMAILEEVARRFGMALSPVAGAVGRAMESRAGALLPAPAGAPTGGYGALMARPAPQITIEAGAFQINNPEPEPASKSVADSLRSVSEFGLFGGDE